MSLTKDLTYLSDSDQKEKISYHIKYLESHLKDLKVSLGEIQIDLFYTMRHLEDLKEAIYASSN